MAGQNDFLIFDENQDNMLTQENYAIDTDRTDGFQTGLARSNVTNKVLHQTSMMCHAIGECIKEIDGTATDSGSVSDLQEAIKNALQGDFSRNIGEIVASAVPLTDAGLHLFDGVLIQGLGVYSAFVTYIAGLRTDYPDLFTTEALWQQSVTTYGVCGKFVYDSVNNTVRLPKITGIVEGTTDLTALGDLVQAGLPNITGGSGEGSAAFNPNGAFYGIAGDTQYDRGSGSYCPYAQFGFDASRSNSIYGNSSTVQPQTIKVLCYIVIATSTKTEIEADIDEIATDLNGKADTDLTNVTNVGNIKMANASMPSNSKFIDLAVGASLSSYTAPADGWFNLGGASANNASWISSENSGTGVTNKVYSCVTSIPAGTSMALTTPVKKGTVCAFGYGNMSNVWLRFVYAVGSESEAN